MAYQKKELASKKQSVKDKLRLRKKESKKKLKEKRARLVVKNLPFTVTEDNLRDHFAKYGDITDIKMLKKEDGKLLGCAFIQFKLVQKANKAKFHTNGQPFLGRNLDVDFAMAKNQYQKKQIKAEKEVKEEPSDEKPAVKEECHEENDHSGTEIDCSDEDEDSVDEDIKDEKNKHDLPRENNLRVPSNDVTEGKTIFIKNVPFTATNEDLKECMSQFGPMYYGLICMDKFTEHSKGTAFVKFCFKEDAEKALQAGTELTLLGNILDCHKALNKNEILSKHDQKMNEKKDIKDSRNLYLVKEGVIMAGSKAAEGVSNSDMTKRLQLEQYKTQMLKNLNMFVSRERLVIHNIPSSWDDKKLRILCQKFAGKGAKLKEARIMRDLKDVDAKGVGKSKEFGFLTFDSHENALCVLRNLNNNPNIFSKLKRPIVSFSIEKRSAIKSKLKRLERSRLKNPKSKFFNPNTVDQVENGRSQNVQQNENLEENMKTFSGVPAQPGIAKMRSRNKLSTQAKKHFENTKKEKKNKKLVKKTLAEKRQEFTKQERQKIKKGKDDSDNFSKLVSKYKKTISGAPSLKTKWYSNT